MQSIAEKGLLLVLPGAPAGAGRHHEPAAVILPINSAMPDSPWAVRHCIIYERAHAISLVAKVSGAIRSLPAMPKAPSPRELSKPSGFD